MTSRFVVLLVALVACLVAGCPGPTFVVQQYRGPQRPQETIAMLRVNGNEPVRLLILDDQDVAAPIVEDGRLHIEMLPGRHTVVVGNANAPSERYAPITFEAQAGKVYRVTLASGPSGGEARVFEVDRGKDTAVRDVTQAPATEQRPVEAPAHAPAPAPAEDAGVPASDASAGAPAADAG